MSTCGASTKNISADSWGQCASFRRSEQEKKASIHNKNSLFVGVCAELVPAEE